MLARVSFFLFILFFFSSLGAKELSLSQLYREGKYRQALALACERDYPSCLNRSFLWEELGEFDSAEEALRECYRNTKHKEILYYLGRLSYLNSQPQEAIKFLKQSLASQSNNLWSWVYLGLAYQDLHSYKKALSSYRGALRIFPSQVIALVKSGECYYHLGQYKKAIRMFRKARSYDASLSVIYKFLGKSFEKVGDYAASFYYFSQALRFFPGEEEISRQLSRLRALLGPQYFYEQKKAKLRRYQQTQVYAAPVYRKGWQPQIRVRLAKRVASCEFKSAANFKIEDAEKKIFTGRARTNYRLVFKAKNKLDIEELEHGSYEKKTTLILPLTMEGTRPDNTFLIFRLYIDRDKFWFYPQPLLTRGELKLVLSGNKMALINYLGLEEYIYGVLSSEMSYHWPQEALKAQAVAARTKALFIRNINKNKEFDVDSGSSVQVYKGIKGENDKIRRAVDETKGEVLVYKDKLFDVFFSSNCGGCTQEFALSSYPYYKYSLVIDSNKIKNITLIPYELDRWLRYGADVFCRKGGASFRWVRSYSALEVEKKMVSLCKNIGRLVALQIKKRDLCGRVKEIIIKGEEKSIVISGEQLRRLLGLRSSFFKIEMKKRGGKLLEFIFLGAGFGHGIGMCQYGARGMAEEGNNYREILSHYYKKTKIKKLY